MLVCAPLEKTPNQLSSKCKCSKKKKKLRTPTTTMTQERKPSITVSSSRYKQYHRSSAVQKQYRQYHVFNAHKKNVITLYHNCILSPTATVAHRPSSHPYRSPSSSSSSSSPQAGRSLLLPCVSFIPKSAAPPHPRSHPIAAVSSPS